mgnify:CR=1 FL=1
MNIRKHIPRGFLFILVGFFAVFGCNSNASSDREAPNFSLSDLSGRTTSLKDYRGTVVLLDFWATWCPPCRLSIPELVQIQAEYRDQGVTVLGISMDDPGQFPDAYLKAFKEKYQINYPILRGDQEVMEKYFGNAPPAIPTMFVIDRQGQIRERIVGFSPGAVEDSLENLLE